MEENNFINEEKLPNHQKSIPFEVMAKLTELSKTNICKIFCNDEEKGTGFFVNIPFYFSNTLKVLMTTNQVLNQSDILPGQKIKFSINNDSKEYNILMIIIGRHILIK